jgi:hypothetical protein
MDKNTVIKIRKELHNLPGKERSMALPIRIVGSDGNYSFSEADCCMLWDDTNEVVYIICPNTVPTQTTDSRLYPMSVRVMDYASIEMIGTVLDRLCLDNLLKAKVGEGLTNEETRKRYYQQMTDLWDERTYFMGHESPTTEKRGLRPDDEIVDKDATRFL